MALNTDRVPPIAVFNGFDASPNGPLHTFLCSPHEQLVAVHYSQQYDASNLVLLSKKWA